MDLKQRVKKFLFIYNAIQSVAWGYTLFAWIYCHYYYGQDVTAHLWEHLSPVMLLSQVFQILEVAFFVAGLVESNRVEAFAIVLRIMLLYITLQSSPKAQHHITFSLMAICWSVQQFNVYFYHAIRYQYPQLIGYKWKWFRYTLAVPLSAISVPIWISVVHVVARSPELWESLPALTIWMQIVIFFMIILFSGIMIGQTLWLREVSLGKYNKPKA